MNSLDIQNLYNKLYALLRGWIWDVDTVVKIAELEVAIYEAFPSLSNIRKKIEVLRQATRLAEKDDEDLRKAYQKLSDLVNSGDSLYFPVHKVQEVISK